MSSEKRTLTALEVLQEHEIDRYSFNPVPGNGNPRTGGFWVAIARCRCGYTSPPEHRAEHLARELAHAAAQHSPITCSRCHRERTPDDVHDYHPSQAMTGKPLGWYSGGGGEMCPECMTDIMSRQL